MLGDRIEQALTHMGISSRRVEVWLGVTCGCEERRDKLNALDSWARRVLRGKIEKAREYLGSVIGND